MRAAPSESRALLDMVLSTPLSLVWLFLAPRAFEGAVQGKDWFFLVLTAGLVALWGCLVRDSLDSLSTLHRALLATGILVLTAGAAWISIGALLGSTDIVPRELVFVLTAPVLVPGTRQLLRLVRARRAPSREGR